MADANARSSRRDDVGRSDGLAAARRGTFDRSSDTGDTNHKCREANESLRHDGQRRLETVAASARRSRAAEEALVLRASFAAARGSEHELLESCWACARMLKKRDELETLPRNWNV